MNENEKELQAMKLWLFSENVRIENEKKNLLELQNRLTKERLQFQEEMKLLNQKIAVSQQRLKQDQAFFDKKLQILQNGFMELDLDRKKLKREKDLFEQEQSAAKYMQNKINEIDGSVLFAGVDNLIALKKRYRDLLKIFHPDNIAGDNEVVLFITEEYEKRRAHYAL